jgi:hypothetical protein
MFFLVWISRQLFSRLKLKDFINKIKSRVILSSKAEEYVVSIATEKSVSKGDVLIRQGLRMNKNTFIPRPKLH